MRGLQMLGAVGQGGAYGWVGPLIQTAGGFAQAGVQAHDEGKAKEEAERVSAAALAKVVSADARAAEAMANAWTKEAIAEKSPHPALKEKEQRKAEAARAVAQVALDAQSRAAAGLSPDASSKRAERADAALQAAASAAQKKPDDVYERMLVKAWTEVVNRARYGEIASRAPGQPGGQGGQSPAPVKRNWLWRDTAIPPVPNAVVVAGGAALAGGALWALKRFVLNRAGV